MELTFELGLRENISCRSSCEYKVKYFDKKTNKIVYGEVINIEQPHSNELENKVYNILMSIKRDQKINDILG